MAHQTIYIIGAGIIGVSCGVNLARRGFAVHYIDHREPGSAASFGNAGALVSFGVLPEAAPEVFRKALRWMLQKDGFVKMQPRYLPQMVEWFYHYWKASKRSNLHPATKALSQLVAYSQKTLWPTVAETNAGALVERSGGLSVYDDAASLAAEVASLDAYKEVHGYDFGYETLSPEELFQAEPDLPRVPRYGLLSPDDAAIRNPGELVNRWFQSSLEGGGSFIKNRVRGFETEQRKIARILLQDGKDIALGDAAVLVAAGAWSHRLAGTLDYRVPLRASRGYHLNFPDPELSFRRTVLFEDHGFMLNHMTTGLRFAGTVEYDDPDRPMNPKRVESLRKRVFRCFPSLADEEHTTWFGSRPSLPDSLPVVSGSARYDNAFFAFGHGSLGMTNASATGALMADLVTKQPTEIDVDPFRIDRFKLP